MLLASERLLNTPVMSLQTGGQLALTKAAIIDPRNLSIVAFELNGHLLDQQPSFLLISDIRELSNLGFIVDSSDEFVGVEDIIKLKEVYAFHFQLIDKVVHDKKKTKLGKVHNYSVEPQSFLIKQLSVKRPLLKSLTDTELLIDRTQIAEINDTAIIIDHDERQPAPAKKAVNAYTNPFRGTRPQPEAIQSDQ